MHYVLGIDGGGTKTDCILMDEARRILSRTRSGPSNPMRVGFGGALASICEAIRSATQSARIPTGEIIALCAGLAGTGHPESQRKMRRLLEEEFPAVTVQVCTDLELTLAATADGAAIVLIAGTGSAAVGRDAAGRTARVGGHGPLLGDDGGAYDIGRHAAIAAIRQFDRTAVNSALGARILGEIEATSWQEFQSRVIAGPDEVFPRLFPVVARAADEGDLEAKQLFHDAASDLAALVASLVERLDLQGQKFLMAKSGGILGRSVFFDRELEARLRETAPQAEFGALGATPAESAAFLALQSLQLQQQEGK